MKFRIAILLFIILFQLSGCTSRLEMIQPVSSIVGTSTPTITNSPSATAGTPEVQILRETATVFPSPSLTATPILTNSPYPITTVDFSKARIYGTEDRGSYFLVIFEIPGLDHAYYVAINDSDYQCEFQEEVVDKLFCNGNKLRSNEYVRVIFFDSDPAVASDRQAVPSIFEGEMYVVEPFKTPLPIGDPATWCPDRGQNIYCETEHRVENDEECWVSTCVDACGYYYSYHTCQLPPNNNFLTP